MRLVEIQLDGFGRLTNRHFQFGDGFNLIFGLNETGKSTLQRAVVALLYGFFGEGRRIKSTERDDLSIFQPWDEDANYAGSLIYTLDDEQTFQVVRQFGSKPATTLSTHPDGSDISKRFKTQSQGRLFFADKQLGMGKEVFENTCYIRQAELIALENSANAITDTLMRLSAAASTDTTATSAIALLKETFKEKVGTSRARTKPLPKAKKQLEVLENERNQVLEQRRELSSKTIELNQARAHLHKLETERTEWRYLETQATINDLGQQLAAASEVAAEVNKSAEEMTRWENWIDFPVDLRDDVIKLTTQHETLVAECDEAQRQAEEAEEKRQPLAEEIAAIEERMAELAGVKDVQPENLVEVQELATQWRMACQATQSSQERWQKTQSRAEELEPQSEPELVAPGQLMALGPTGLAQLQQQWLAAQAQVAKTTEKFAEAETAWGKVDMTEAQFVELEQKVEQIQTAAVPVSEPRRGCKLFSFGQPAQSIPQTPTEVEIYNDLKPIHTDLIQARTEVEEAREALTKIETSLRETLGDMDGDTINENTFAELNRKLEQYLQAEAEFKQQKKMAVDLQSDLDTARRKEEEAQKVLQTKLTELELDISDLEAAVDTYVEQCEQKARLEREETELEKLQLQIQALNRTVKQGQEKQQALEATAAGLCKILAQADIECSTDADALKAALDKFEEGVQNHRRWAEAQQAHQAAIKRQEAFSTVETYEKSLAELEDKLAKMQADHPELAQLQAEEPAQTYAARREQVEHNLSTAQTELNDLQNSMGQISGNSRHLAEIDEEIGQIKTRIQKLEWYGNILQLAQEELTQATEEFQKQFAPKLEALMGEDINRITNGRYQDIHVDPKNLAVSMTAPELGQAVNAERLSTGTRELVYLMLRVSIARLMSRTGEQLPLLLDDPLVQCDRGRQEQTLAFLSRLAEETQVFLFTKDEWVKTWFEENLGQLAAHKLHILE